MRDPSAHLLTAVACRFRAARPVCRAHGWCRRRSVLGPLAVDALDGGYDGLLLAGDAAGFIDPMTGDGLRFAVRGGELAALAALAALANGWPGVTRTARSASAAGSSRASGASTGRCARSWRHPSRWPVRRRRRASRPGWSARSSPGPAIASWPSREHADAGDARARLRADGHRGEPRCRETSALSGHGEASSRTATSTG